MRPAVFWDRDGTIIEHVHHLVDAADVRLIDGAGVALRELSAAGFANVLVTNQSVLGRGLIDEAGLQAVHQVMNDQLAAHQAELDGVYFCPVVPGSKDPYVVEHPDRKPGPGMLLRAASQLEIDLRRSWMVGDSLSDMVAGRNANCHRTILVRTGFGSSVNERDDAIDHVVVSIREAAELILQSQRNPAQPA